MTEEFTHAIFGGTGKKICRLGLSATYRPGKDVIYEALDEGINFFFCYGFDTQMTKTLRDIFKTNREKYLVATGAYNLLLGHPNLRRTLEKRLRQLGTDYIDTFLYLGVMKEKHPNVWAAIGLSTSSKSTYLGLGEPSFANLRSNWVFLEELDVGLDFPLIIYYLFVSF